VWEYVCFIYCTFKDNLNHFFLALSPVMPGEIEDRVITGLEREREREDRVITGLERERTG
jgi:hypothetical protein